MSQIKKYKNCILIGTGIGLQIAGTITAIEATKNVPNLNECNNKKEFIKKNIVLYIPSVLLHAAGITSIVMAANNMQNMVNSALMLAGNAYSTLNTYKTKTKEIVGEKTKEKIDSAVAKEEIEKSQNDLVPLDGKQLFREPITGQEFFSTWADIEKAAIYVNKVGQSGCGYITVNDWLSALNITRGGDVLDCIGWKVYDGNIIEPIPSMVMKGNYPIGQIEYAYEPCPLKGAII